MDSRDQTIYDLKGALAAKDVLLEILRHRLNLMEQATVAPTVLPTVCQKRQDAANAVAALEAENQELRGQAWELQQYVAILEGRLQKANDHHNDLWSGTGCPTNAVLLSQPEGAATVPQDATVVCPSLFHGHGTPTTRLDLHRQELEELRVMLLQREGEVADLKQQLATVELGLANVIACNGTHVELEFVMEDLIALHRPLTQRGALQSARQPESHPPPAHAAELEAHTAQLEAHTAQLEAHTAQLEAELAELRQRYQQALEQQKGTAWEAQGLRAELSDLQQQLATFEELQSKWAEGEGRVQRATSHVEVLESELQRRTEQLSLTMEELGEERAKTEALRERIGELLDRAQQAEMTVVEREEELSRTSYTARPACGTDAETVVSCPDGLQARLEEQQAMLEDLQDELAAKAARVAQLEGLLNAAPSPVEVRALKERMRLRDAEVSDLKAMLEDQRGMTEVAEGNVAAVEARCNELQAHLGELRRLRTEERPRVSERPTCLKCDLYATQLATQREELEAIITDLRYEVENQTVELAARALNIAELSAQVRRLEDDTRSVDALKKQIQELKLSKDFLTAELESLQLNDYHHSGHRRSQKDKVLVIAPGEPVDKKRGWRELISSKHQVQFNAVELAAEEGEAVKGAVIKSRSGQGVCVTFGEDFLNGSGLEKVSSQHLRSYQPYIAQSPSASDTGSPSPKYILARNPGSPTGRPSVLVRSPSNLQWM